MTRQPNNTHPDPHSEAGVGRMKKYPKVGDRVWVKLPMNATIVRSNKRRGFTLKTDDGVLWSYLSEDEIEVI